MEALRFFLNGANRSMYTSKGAPEDSQSVTSLGNGIDAYFLGINYVDSIAEI